MPANPHSDLNGFLTQFCLSLQVAKRIGPTRMQGAFSGSTRCRFNKHSRFQHLFAFVQAGHSIPKTSDISLMQMSYLTG